MYIKYIHINTNQYIPTSTHDVARSCFTKSQLLAVEHQQYG